MAVYLGDVQPDTENVTRLWSSLPCQAIAEGLTHVGAGLLQGNCYTRQYLDGAKHVQVSLAMDAIMAGVMEKRKNISLGFLCSPTDCLSLIHI